MRDFIDFCLVCLTEFVELLFSLDIGGYSYGDFMVAALVIGVFVGSLVISFRSSNSAGSAARPMRSGGYKSKGGGSDNGKNGG